MGESPRNTAAYTAGEYMALADLGVISPDDRVELLEGLIVAMSPQSPEHAAAIWRAVHVLERSIPSGAIVRSQSSFLASEVSVPEPDVCVVEGSVDDYESVHPSRALLVVEVASSSLAADRLTKSRIYAAAAIPEYWILNLRDRVVEAYTEPDLEARVYSSSVVYGEHEKISPRAVAGCRIAVRELLPRERASSGSGKS